MFSRKQAIRRWFIFPSHLISASALPCKTRNTEITFFPFNAVFYVARHQSLLDFFNLVDAQHIFVVMYNSLDLIINGVCLLYTSDAADE